MFEKDATLRYMGEMTAAELRQLREKCGLSQRAFAKILKVSHMMINRAEEDGPSRALILYIERAFEDGSLKFVDQDIKPE
jgi:DNA-binding transcriptional regulator YiaG